MFYFKSSSSSVFSAQGHIFHCKLMNQGCSSAQGRSSTANLGTKVIILLGINQCGSFQLLSAPTLSLASEHTLKDPRGPNVGVRRVDLANCALRISQKFTRWVKYQLHQGFWPGQRSGNPNHPSPPKFPLYPLIHYVNIIVFAALGILLKGGGAFELDLVQYMFLSNSTN